MNPVSGRKKAQKVTHALSQRLRRRGHGVRILETSPDRTEFEARCRTITSEERVVCVGGDGTLLYFLNVCRNFHGVAFYGTGTANVMRWEFGLPHDIQSFVRMLELDRRVILFPGRLQSGSEFLMMCSFGIDAYVLSLVSQRLKNRISKVAFLWPAIKAFWSYPFPEVSLALDDGRRLKGSLAVITRISRYGGSFILAPQADATQKKLHLVVLTKRGRLATLGFFLRLFWGRAGTAPGVAAAAADSVRVHAEQGAFFQLDGDYCEEMVSEVRVSGRAISFIIPKTL